MTEIPAVECEALVALYNSTDGPGWLKRTGWLADSTPCSTPWYGVRCDSGHVVELSLSRNQLSGAIPPELGNLAHLGYLYLGGNGLSGAIPPELGNLANLQGLYLWENGLSGAIPPGLGNLANLYVLYLWGNQLSGAIPPELGNLAKLESLSLHSNQFSGAIPPELGNLAHLQELHLENNQLSGAIPPELGNMANLYYLVLSSNQLSGAIPPELGNLANLLGLYLSKNQLSGAIPPELGNLARLGCLSLSSNGLSGAIPPRLGKLTNLYYLDLSGNQLSGAIPVQLCNLFFTQYQAMNLGYNALTSGPACIATYDPDWETTQTVPPVNLAAVLVPPQTAQLSWTPIPYTGDGGYYEVFYATTPGGSPALHGITADKSAGGYLAGDLTPGTTYYFKVRTYTPAHGDQQNALTSVFSAEFSPVTVPGKLWRVYLPMIRKSR